MRPSPPEAGFTLVELMIVLVIVGLMSAAVAVALPGGEADARREAERLAARAKAARDRAVIEARPVALRVGPDGYDFRRKLRGEWQAIASPPLEPRRWGDEVEAVGEATVVFDPTGLAAPARVVLRRGDAEATVTIGADGGVEVHG